MKIRCSEKGQQVDINIGPWHRGNDCQDTVKYNIKKLPEQGRKTREERSFPSSFTFMPSGYFLHPAQSSSYPRVIHGDG